MLRIKNVITARFVLKVGVKSSSEQFIQFR